MAGTGGRPIHYKDIQGVLSGYDLQDTPNYAIFLEKQIMYQYCADDDTGLAKLKENLQAVQQSGSTALYTIKFYQEVKKGCIDRNTPESGAFNFRLTEPADSTSSIMKLQQDGSNNKFIEFLLMERDNLKDKVEYLEERVNEMENEDEAGEPDDLLGKIGEAGNKYPWLQEIIKEGMSVVKSFVHDFNLKKPAADHTRIAGITDNMNSDQKIEWALQTLLDYYTNKNGSEQKGGEVLANDLVKLAELAQGKSFVFDAAIQQLRSL